MLVSTHVSTPSLLLQVTRLVILFGSISHGVLGESQPSGSSSAREGQPLQIYCQKYLIGLTQDIESYSNFLALYRAAVQISAKAHTNAHQETREAGPVNFTSYPHDQQRYDGSRYTTHLIAVESVLRRFGFLPKSSIDARLLKLGARMHDVSEDTPLSVDILGQWFGPSLAGLVDSVKKVEESEKISKEEAKVLTYRKVLTHPLGTALKLADRIANVEHGLRKNKILPKYIKDYGLFRSILYRPGSYEEMWAYLDYLIKNQQFPPDEGYWSLRLKGLRFDRRTKLEGPLYDLQSIRMKKEKLPAITSPTNKNPDRLDPSSIHFMQRYVDELMGNQKYSVIETAHDLKNQQITTDQMPPLEVWTDSSGKIWTLDHRRLASIRLAEVKDAIPVKWVSSEKVHSDEFKFDPWKDGKSIQILLDDGSVVVPRS